MQGAYTDLAFEALDLLKVLLATLDSAVAAGGIHRTVGYAGLFTARNARAAACAAPPPAAAAAAWPVLVREGQAAPPKSSRRWPRRPGRRPSVGEILIDQQAVRAKAVAHALRAQQPNGGTEADATIKVSTARLDNLINMVGELVIAQSMVSQDPALKDLAESAPRAQRLAASTPSPAAFRNWRFRCA